MQLEAMILYPGPEPSDSLSVAEKAAVRFLTRFLSLFFEI